MNDPRTDAILQAAVRHLQAAVTEALDRLTLQLGPLALAASNNQQRQWLTQADSALRRHAATLQHTFSVRLHERLAACLVATADVAPPRGLPMGGASDWSALTLVDNAEVERTVQADRLGQLLGSDCAEPLAALDGLLATLMDERQLAHHALRPNRVAEVMLQTLSECEPDPDVCLTLGQQLGRVLAPHLGGCYEQVASDLRRLGVQPRQQRAQIQRSGGSAGRTGPSSQAGPITASSGHAPLAADTGQGVWANPSGWSGTGPGQDPEAHLRAARALSAMFGLPSAAAQDAGLPPMRLRTASGSPGTPGGRLAPAPSDFRALIDRINRDVTPQAWPQRLAPAQDDASGLHAAPGFAGPLMATNLIRAHRDELVRASGGAALDQMVIDIVAALFDQVLSDPKVAPEMARQIARLQMPVLRVALADMGFFHSRKHPVRRFVNRMATLSAAYESLQEGAGKACLERVTALVDDIVEGDFERMALYESKLTELERHVEQGHAVEAAESAAVRALLSGKEADLRVQQRYMQALKRELAEVALPDFVRDFLTQIWSQVQVMASARDGAQSDLAARMRKAGHDLALSVQPKGSPTLRKHFLMMLPQLMKDLNEGLALIQWPEEARQAFFSQLLPAHAESLKQAPEHDLTRRLLEQQLLKVGQIAIPSREEAANDPLPASASDAHVTPAVALEATLSPDEAHCAGLLPEAAVPGDVIDIDLDALGGEVDPSLTEVDINLDMPPPPVSGLQLVHHIQKGTAYQMMMQGAWQRVRLTWVSEGRAFFIFNQGQQHKRTISLTARTLAKMCETGRFRAFEQSELLERATIRARRQLAALGTGQQSVA